jgi:hypothetical protein
VVIRLPFFSDEFARQWTAISRLEGARHHREELYLIPHQIGIGRIKLFASHGIVEKPDLPIFILWQNLIMQGVEHLMQHDRPAGFKSYGWPHLEHLGFGCP